MGAVPILRTWSVGEVATAAELNSNVRDAINFLLSVPRCIVTRSTSLTVNPGAAPSAIGFDVETVDNDTMHASSNSSMQVHTAGMYECFIQVHYNALTGQGETAYCFVGFQLNGSTWGTGSWVTQDVRCFSGNAGFGTSCQVGLDLKMNSGDQVSFFVAQTGSASVSINSGNFGSQATLQWVATT